MSRERTLYDDPRWSKLRKWQLAAHPLCILCKQVGIVTEATVVDHRIPHRGNLELFWDRDNLQSVCEICHNASKAQQERYGYSTAVGLDGYPIDEFHPWNQPVKIKRKE
jgi:5-methylcytosine-specific restriction enzyme A